MKLYSRPTKIISLLQNSNGVIKDQKRPQTVKEKVIIQKVSPLSITITQKEYFPQQIIQEQSKKSYSIQKLELNPIGEQTCSCSSPRKRQQSMNLSVRANESKYRPNSAGNKQFLSMAGRFSYRLRKRRLSEDDTFLIAGSSVQNQKFGKTICGITKTLEFDKR